MTIFDLLLMIAASWALPAAALTLGFGRASTLLAVISAPMAMVWWVYCQRLGSYLFVEGKEEHQVSTRTFLGQFALILSLTVAVQFAIYRLLLAAAGLFA